MDFPERPRTISLMFVFWIGFDGAAFLRNIFIMNLNSQARLLTFTTMIVDRLCDDGEIGILFLNFGCKFCLDGGGVDSDSL